MALYLKITLAVSVAYFAIALAAYFGQRRLMYFPDATRVSPASLGLVNVEERILMTLDGESIIAWSTKARPGQPTILYFPGNGGNLALRAERLSYYQSQGLGMFIMSYRGYSGSSGSPTEAANVADAALAYDTLVRDGLRPRDIVVYGESLGSGVAVQLAAQKPVGGVILDAPYTSTVDVGKRRYPFLPVDALMQDRYDTMRNIGQVKAPLLIVHGDRDTVVPFDLGRKVFEAANQPKTFVPFPGAGHDDHYLFGSYDTILGWIRKLRSPGGHAAQGATANQRERRPSASKRN